MDSPKQIYPSFSLSERIADGAMHLIGVSGALAGAIVLAVLAIGELGFGQTIALSVYGVALVLTFVASAFYHMTPWEGLRPYLRRIDHAAIYVKIAGTYTPLVIMIGSLSAYFVLIAVWLLAAFGVVQKLFFWRVPGKFGTGLYLVMGWMSVAIVWSLIPVLPTSAMWLIGMGGLLYTFGVVFHVWENLKFSNAIWHGFVVAASACFYVAISLGTQANLV